MEQRPYTRDDGLEMVDVTVSTNDFTRDHPALATVMRDVLEGKIEGDLTIEQFTDVEDKWITSPWEKARWVVENVACLWAAHHLVGWGEGYRSDDGYDYLDAALDGVRCLTNIDLSEADFMMWWNADPNDYEATDSMGNYIGCGASDGEVRYMIFPKRWGGEFDADDS